MSAPALAQAVRDVIQANVLLNNVAIDSNTCEVGFDGSPKASSGQIYIGVHLGSWTPMSGDWDLHEEYQVSVTVTLRLGTTPQDRQGLAAWVKATTGLDAICRQIITLLHHNQTVRAKANLGQSYSIGAASAGFLTTVQFVGAQPPKFQKAGWWFAKEDRATMDAADPDVCGVSQELRFGKAQRCQGIDGTQT